VTDGQRVYVVFGSSVVAAIELNGKLAWRKDIPDWQSFDVAIASSPILYRGQLLVLADRNEKKSTLTAYDSKTGDVLWEKQRPDGAFDHTTPVVIDNSGQMQMLVAASGELQAIDPATGEKLWWCRTPGDVTSPVFSRGLVFTDSGRGGPGILVDASGKGDVSATHVKWKIDQIPEGLSSPAIMGDYLYRLHNPGVLKCVALGTGKEVYATRLNGASVAASPIVTPDGRLYLASAGKTFVVQSGPTFELLATNDLGEPTSSSAAASINRLYLKGQKHLFCVGEK
jgi:outer membrane protein assembly factor BamB